MASPWRSPDVLSVKQREVLQFMLDFLTENGRMPKTSEIMQKVGVGHKQSVIKSINVLIAKGFLDTSGAGRGRTLSIVGAKTRVEILGGKLGRRLLAVLAGEPPYAVRTDGGEGDAEHEDACRLQEA